jgi:hypothetical protein
VNSSRLLFRASAILWGVWGLFHLLVGGFLLSLLFQGDTAEAVHGIAGTVELTSLQVEYPPAVVATLKQHAFNLGWFGLATLVGSPFVWRRNAHAIFFCAIVGGLGDLGYLLFIDLPGLAVPPGPQMTWISAAAIVLSFFAYFRTKESGSQQVSGGS